MSKRKNEYDELYGDIPCSQEDRINKLMNSMSKRFRDKFNIDYEIERLNKIKWKSLDFVIYLVPKATPRPRLSRKTNRFYVVGASDNKKIFKDIIEGSDYELITTPCKFKCVSYLPIPKSMSIKDKIMAELGLIYPISKPDWDNVGKSYSDMIQGLLLYDDALIVEGISIKKYSSKPRVEIHIEYMEEMDSDFNNKKIRKKV